jgi:hypothetical protein
MEVSAQLPQVDIQVGNILLKMGVLRKRIPDFGFL